jgi:hypothetical protein
MGALGSAEGEVARTLGAEAKVRAGTAGAVRCSVCGAKTAREELRGIEVDRCAEHGMWFDRDEVLHVLNGTKPKARTAAVAAAAAGTAVAGAAILSAQQGDRDLGLRVLDVGGNVAGDLAVDGSLEIGSSVVEGVIEVVAGLLEGLG